MPQLGSGLAQLRSRRLDPAGRPSLSHEACAVRRPGGSCAPPAPALGVAGGQHLRRRGARSIRFDAHRLGRAGVGRRRAHARAARGAAASASAAAAGARERPQRAERSARQARRRGRVQAQHLGAAARRRRVEVGRAPHAAVDVLAPADRAPARRSTAPRTTPAPPRATRRRRARRGAEHDAPPAAPVDGGDAQPPVERAPSSVDRARAEPGIARFVRRARPSAAARAPRRRGAPTRSDDRRDRRRERRGAERGRARAANRRRAVAVRSLGPVLAARAVGARFGRAAGGERRRRRSSPPRCRRSTRSRAGPSRLGFQPREQARSHASPSVPPPARTSTSGRCEGLGHASRVSRGARGDPRTTVNGGVEGEARRGLCDVRSSNSDEHRTPGRSRGCGHKVTGARPNPPTRPEHQPPHQPPLTHRRTGPLLPSPNDSSPTR